MNHWRLVGRGDGYPWHQGRAGLAVDLQREDPGPAGRPGGTLWPSEEERPVTLRLLKLGWCLKPFWRN